VYDYVIGDVQGCFEPLQRLLDHINFDEHADRLWFVGDLVNRGPQSLSVLRFIKNLPLTPRITLGNHDLHLLAKLFCAQSLQNRDDTLHEIVTALDAHELGHWLRKQPILYHDPELNIVMCHAGIAPVWSLSQAKALSRELEQVLSGEHYRDYLAAMYGNMPDYWSDDWVGMDRLRVICNYFTRMRFCDAQGHLMFMYQGTIAQAPDHLYPWYMVPCRHNIEADIVFGHWAALQGICSHPRIHALDTGCYWGGQLTALRLQDKRRFEVPGMLIEECRNLR
jgi:bis(5'-nucleosyl)-tetraphosphatase (symmetrical)